MMLIDEKELAKVKTPKAGKAVAEEGKGKGETWQAYQVTAADGNAFIFADGDGNRPAIRLGKATKNQAEKFKDKVEALIAGKITGAPVDDEVSRWLAALPDTMHARIVAVGLAKPRQAENVVTLRNLYDEFFAALKAKPGTHAAHKQAADSLLSISGNRRRCRDITR